MRAAYSENTRPIISFYTQVHHIVHRLSYCPASETSSRREDAAMKSEIKLLITAIRMALKEPKSVGQKSLSMVLGASVSRESVRTIRQED